jgi:hypothetical protein
MMVWVKTFFPYIPPPEQGDTGEALAKPGLGSTYGARPVQFADPAVRQQQFRQRCHAGDDAQKRRPLAIMKSNQEKQIIHYFMVAGWGILPAAMQDFGHHKSGVWWLPSMPRILRLVPRRSTCRPHKVLQYARPSQSHSAFDRLPLGSVCHRWHAD